MINSKLSLLVLTLVLTICMPSLVHAVSANPNPIETEQPDGTTIIVRIFGDEWYHYYESDDGFTILESEDGWWVYADIDTEERFEHTPYRVGMKDPGSQQFLSFVGKHLRENDELTNEAKKLFYSRTMPGIFESARKIAKETGAVNLNVPVVLIQFTDFFHNNAYDNQSFDDMMNQSNYNGTGSFRDYYLEVSYGELTVTATIFGWFTSASPRNTYRRGTGGINGALRAKLLAREAVDRAEFIGGADWTIFDNDFDSNVDIVFIVHQGLGAECGPFPLPIAGSNFIWSHAWFLNVTGLSLANPPVPADLSVIYDGVQIDRYCIQPEVSCPDPGPPGSHIQIGVFCHEFGHILGLPDLYDATPTGATHDGIGRWGLMGGGNWGGDGASPETPTHMSAWSKFQLGWVTPTVITANTVGSSIAAVETTPQVYQLWTNGVIGQEYFLIENRQQTLFDATLPNSGLLIWHIDESQRQIDNTDNQDVNHKLVDLEEADNLNNLDIIETPNISSDAGDIYPGSSNNTTFNGGTSPNSDDYAGSPTLVGVENISPSSMNMTADFFVATAGTPNLVIRDCAADIGDEPDAACASNWVQSLDIWVDNNDDGMIDDPIKGQINHLYVRGWNIGAPTTNAKVKCYFVNPSLGLLFPGAGTQIVDALTFQNEKTIQTVGTLNPSVGGTGYRVFFNWNIPNPPPNIDHYCIGCIIENAADPQFDQNPLQDNNLGQINYWALALKSGTTPKNFAKSSASTTVFREAIKVKNYDEVTHDFAILVEDLDSGYTVSPGFQINLTLGPFADSTILIDLIMANAQHKDSTPVVYKLYRLPGWDIQGGLAHDILIDDYQPLSPPGFEVNMFEPPGDNYPRPSPKYELTWFAPATDTGGFDERVRYYDIHYATDSTDLIFPDGTTLLKRTGADDDPLKPGYQYLVFPPDTLDYYFTVVAVDLADNQSWAPAPQTGREVSGCCSGTVGDANMVDDVTVGDIAAMVNMLFGTGVVPDGQQWCLEEADVNFTAVILQRQISIADITVGDIAIIVELLFGEGGQLALCP